MVLFNKVRRWLTLADYEDSKLDASKRILSRFSRGNVLLQHGAYITRNDLQNRSRAADRSMRAIQKAAERAH